MKKQTVKSKSTPRDFKAAVYHLVHYVEDYLIARKTKTTKLFDASVLKKKCQQVKQMLEE